ncbi:MAG TPA: LysM-like peptidoglycan-binding domain-containing protein, partial [Gammaproteobacteria bacterium]|nr:LysM-like peptidoglycan-binding domain-containing protein [Gammaproteobacteria bacterium]
MKESLTALQADYKPGPAPAAARPRVRRHYWLLLALATAGAGAFEFFNTAAAGHAVETEVASLPAAAVPAAPLYTTADLRVAPGDNLATLFADRNLSASDLQAIIDAGNGTERLKRIVPGDIIRVAYTPDGHVQTLHMGYD